MGRTRWFLRDGYQLDLGANSMAGSAGSVIAIRQQAQTKVNAAV